MRRALEALPHLELEALDAVRRDRIEREGIAELERSDRRIPSHGNAGGVAEVLEFGLRTVDVDLAQVEETPNAHRLFALDERICHLGGADDLALAAQRVAVDVAWSERSRFIAAHLPHAPRIDRLEERARLVAVPVT